MDNKYDFSGWVTKSGVQCADGVVIAKDAFLDCDGKKVPLMWNHDHNDPTNVIGHAILEAKPEGVYGYGYLNDTQNGLTSKKLLANKDIVAMSIFANNLKKVGNVVTHGVIREVSLVVAGANPGACIDHVICHSDDETAAVIYMNESLFHYATEEDAEESEEIEETDTVEENSESVEEEIEESEVDETEDNISHSSVPGKDKDMAENEGKKTVKEVFDSMFNEEQKNFIYGLIGSVIDDEEGDESVKHNIFEGDSATEENVLTHSAIKEILEDGRRYGSVKESFLAHAAEYGIEDIDVLFPEYRELNTPPEFISRDMGWVQKVMGAVSHSPFARVKTTFADITEDEARAKGYMKGKLKKDEVFSLLKRTTAPTTVYKKQKMDRDDIIDITDFDVVMWLKGEMRMMLDEEIARAILVGDGRLNSSDDKIKEDCIRPIWKDEELFTIRAYVDGETKTTNEDRAREFIRQAIRARKNYKGSGNPVLYTTEDLLTEMLLLEDKMGRDLYDSVEKLATKLRVREIIPVPVLENLTREGSGDDSGKDFDLMGLIVNLVDYKVGADKGGAVSMFEDFDIDYNQQKYLIETRCSGALVKPFSAIALELKRNPS